MSDNIKTACRDNPEVGDGSSHLVYG